MSRAAPADDTSRWRRILVEFDVEVGLRAALAAVVPLTILAVAGRLDLAAYAAFGAMTAIFGRRERYRMRVRTVPTAAAALLVSVAIGTTLAAFDAPLWAEAVALGVVLVGGILIVNVVRLGPPTALFFVFGLLVCASIPTRPADVGLRLAVAAASAVLAVALSLSGYLLRRAGVGFKPLGERRMRPEAVRDPLVWLNIVLTLAAGLLAGAVALTFGIGHPYWAVIGAIAVVPSAGAAHSLARAWHRVVGTVAGVGVTALVLWPEPPVAVLVVVVGIAQFGAEVLVGRHYGAALLFVTPLALIVSFLSHPVELGPLLGDRVIETAIGCAAGILAVLAARVITTRMSPQEAAR